MKQNFIIEPYLTQIDNPAHRIALTQIRLSAHHLNIEAMRPTTPDPNKRTCKQCNTDAIEDEEHFLIHCQAYTLDRQQLLQTCSNICPNLNTLTPRQKFIWLMTNENKQANKTLARHIYTTLQHRKQQNRAQPIPNTAQSQEDN